MSYIQLTEEITELEDLNLDIEDRELDKQFVNAYQAHVKRIHRCCLFRTNSYQDAEDITAEVFLKLLRSSNRPTTDDHLLAWLFKVAGNLCANHCRRAAKRQLIERQVQGRQEYVETPWFNAELWTAIKTLKPTQQQVIYLRVVEDLSFRQVAGFLAKNEGAVKVMFYRAVTRLQKSLNRKEA